MTSEFARIASIEALLSRPSRDVALGIGDDSAVLHASSLPRVWTVDAAVEGVHFSRAWMTLEQAAKRAFMAAASDVAAMGGRAVAALTALTFPSSFSDGELSELVRGFARASDACACPIIGGNLARADILTLTTTVLGECPGNVLTRKGARVADGIYVTGTVGAAALGLRALQAGRAAEPLFDESVARFLEPRARLDVALAVAAIASAAIDISDGLAQDLTHLCRASQVGARIDANALPMVAEFARAARLLAADPVQLALSGGEDYELLFTSAADVAPELATRIGEIVEAPARVTVIAADGRELTLERGFDHFADS